MILTHCEVFPVEKGRRLMQSLTMNKFSEESVFLGYHHAHLNSPSTQQSDIDFNDVFGGPPRKSSVIQEARHSFSEPMGIRGETVRALLWHGRGEKPVFGEDSTGNGRRLSSNDFFDDIFRGNAKSLGNSPGKKNNEIASNPGSKISSPVRTSNSKAEPLGTSLPVQFSLPSKLNGATTIPTFGSPVRNLDKNKNVGIASPFSPLSRSSNQEEHKIQEDQGIDPRSSRRNCEALSPKLRKGRKDGNRISEVQVAQFHFSIYKWPSLGVPVDMPLLRASRSSRLKKKNRVKKTGVSSSSKLYQESSELSDGSVNDGDHSKVAFSGMPINAPLRGGISSIAEEIENIASLIRMTEATKEKNPIAPSEKDHEMEKIRNDKTSAHFEKESSETGYLSEMDVHGGIKSENSITLESRRSGERLLELQQNDDAWKGYTKLEAEKQIERMKLENPVGNAKASNMMAKKLEIRSESEVAVKTKSQVRPINSGDNSKGTVKEFVKIFNQGASVSFVTDDADAFDRNLKWKNNKKVGEGDQMYASRTKTNEKIDVPDGNKREPDEDILAKISETSVKEGPDLKYSRNSPNDASKESNSRESSQRLFSEQSSKWDSTNSPVSKQRESQEVRKQKFAEPSYKQKYYKKHKENLHQAAWKQQDIPIFNKEADDVDGSSRISFQVTVLSEDADKPSSPKNDMEDTKAIDAKIKKWSSGKKGNIRSLLSTLQFVLWPQSGWKPVALVDIIDGNAVKRSYQRALLCLHPDKLQQKGASDMQKYTAERVFEILQEAWNFFSTIDSI